MHTQTHTYNPLNKVIKIIHIADEGVGRYTFSSMDSVMVGIQICESVNWIAGWTCKTFQK